MGRVHVGARGRCVMGRTVATVTRVLSEVVFGGEKPYCKLLVRI